MLVIWTPQKLSYFDFLDTVHLVLLDLVLPLDDDDDDDDDDDVMPTELTDGLLLTTSTAVIDTEQQRSTSHRKNASNKADKYELTKTKITKHHIL